MAELPLSALYARSTVIGWQVFFGGFALAGLALLALGFAVPVLRPALLPPAVLMVAVFGALLLLARSRLHHPGPVIRVTAQAYHDRRLGEPIPWTAIRGLRRHQPGRRLLLLVDTDDPGRWLGNAGVLKGPMQRINPRMGFPAVVSRLDGLDVPQADLAAAAEAAWAASRAGS